MTLRRTLPIALLLAGALSCSEATAPSRAPNYEWRLFVQIDALSTDTLSFHWPAGTPVRIWVEDSLDMPARVREGIEVWRTAFLYGEYDAVVVSDSSAADVLVRVTSAPPKAPAAVGRLNTLLSGCGGATDFDIDMAATPFELRLPVRVYVTPKYDPTQVDLTECFRVAAAHELGHALGIFGHSSDAADLMYPDPDASGLSVRDINTAQLAAHWPSNLKPTR